jgi:hypothetical protein
MSLGRGFLDPALSGRNGPKYLDDFAEDLTRPGLGGSARLRAISMVLLWKTKERIMRHTKPFEILDPPLGVGHVHNWGLIWGAADIGFRKVLLRTEANKGCHDCCVDNDMKG